jgi:hypothetical protein
MRRNVAALSFSGNTPLGSGNDVAPALGPVPNPRVVIPRPRHRVHGTDRDRLDFAAIGLMSLDDEPVIASRVCLVWARHLATPFPFR